MPLNESDTMRRAELQGMVAHPGWKIAVEILEERLKLLQRLIMIPEGSRKVDMSDERIRAEFLILTRLRDEPSKLLDSYDTLDRESRTEDTPHPWFARTNEVGMRRAGGFDGQPVDEEDAPA